MDNPTKMDDDWGYPHDLGNLLVHMVNLGLKPADSRNVKEDEEWWDITGASGSPLVEDERLLTGAFRQGNGWWGNGLAIRVVLWIIPSLSSFPI